VVFRGRHVDREAAGAGRGNQLETRQTLYDVAGQRRPLAHDANDVERQESLDDGVRFHEMVCEDGQLRPSRHPRPVGHTQRDVLVVIQDCDSHRPASANVGSDVGCGVVLIEPRTA
jgi:hypothetical protein